MAKRGGGAMIGPLKNRLLVATFLTVLFVPALYAAKECI
jgi:hypothetical protein